jgi:hypothetical protein
MRKFTSYKNKKQIYIEIHLKLYKTKNTLLSDNVYTTDSSDLAGIIVYIEKR